MIELLFLGIFMCPVAERWVATRVIAYWMVVQKKKNDGSERSGESVATIFETEPET